MAQPPAAGMESSRSLQVAMLVLALALGATPAVSVPALAESAKPEVVQRSMPVYPRGALARGIEGWVLVGFTVDPNGKVTSPKVVEATPPGVFDAAALAAVTKWQYKATGADNPDMQVKIDFKLGN
jgi:periplasmic protein TonB